MTLQDFIIDRIINLPGYPPFLKDMNWILQTDVPYSWEGFDFTDVDGNYYLQLGWNGRVMIYSMKLQTIFESQI